jgi:hypothetical protein
LRRDLKGTTLGDAIHAGAGRDLIPGNPEGFLLELAPPFAGGTSGR